MSISAGTLRFFKVLAFAFLLLLVSGLGFAGYILHAQRTAFFKMYDMPDRYTVGPKDADLTIVEFIDYGCKPCREAHSSLIEAARRDGHVRIIPRPLYDEGTWMEQVVLSVYAAGEQGRFAQMHETIIQNWPIQNEQAFLRVAGDAGLEFGRLAGDMQRGEMKDYMRENVAYFKQWRFGEVPVFLMGRAAVYRPKKEDFPVAEAWLQKFADARAGNGFF